MRTEKVDSKENFRRDCGGRPLAAATVLHLIPKMIDYVTIIFVTKISHHI